MPLQPDQDREVRGSIADVERRLHKAQTSLANAVESLDHDNPEGARYALDEAGSEVGAAAREVETTQQTLKTARESS